MTLEILTPRQIIRKIRKFIRRTLDKFITKDPITIIKIKRT